MNCLVAAAYAGVIALDFIGIGPFMISQPIVCGPLLGWLTGHIAVGLIIGAIVQLMWMDVTAVGVGIPYDATATTILAVFWASQSNSPSLSQIVLALVLAVPFGALFRKFDQYARRSVRQVIHRIDSVTDEKLSGAITVGIAGGLLLIFVRYFVLYAVALWVGLQCWQHISYTPRMTWMDRGLTMAVILLPVAGLGICMELLLSDEPTNRWRKKETT